MATTVPVAGCACQRIRAGGKRVAEPVPWPRAVRPATTRRPRYTASPNVRCVGPRAFRRNVRFEAWTAEGRAHRLLRFGPGAKIAGRSRIKAEGISPNAG